VNDLKVAYASVISRKDWESTDQIDLLRAGIEAARLNLIANAYDHRRSVITGTHRVVLAYTQAAVPPLTDVGSGGDWSYLVIVVAVNTRPRLALAALEDA